MKEVFSDRIVSMSGTDPLENKYQFDIATDIVSPIIVDLAELLKDHRNDRAEYRKDYKLWNQVYPGEKELELFKDVVDTALSKKEKIHILNCTLREELEVIRNLYQELGYFDERENRFNVPFSESPVTIGVNIRNLSYSTKDYKSKRESICFIPPPREPGHVRALFAGINSGVISTLAINDFKDEENLLMRLVDIEKTNLTTLAGILSDNAVKIGLQTEKIEKWVVELG